MDTASIQRLIEQVVHSFVTAKEGKVKLASDDHFIEAILTPTAYDKLSRLTGLELALQVLTQALSARWRLDHNFKFTQTEPDEDPTYRWRQLTSHRILRHDVAIQEPRSSQEDEPPPTRSALVDRCLHLRDLWKKAQAEEDHAKVALDREKARPRLPDLVDLDRAGWIEYAERQAHLQRAESNHRHAEECASAAQKAFEAAAEALVEHTSLALAMLC